MPSRRYKVQAGMPYPMWVTVHLNLFFSVISVEKIMRFLQPYNFLEDSLLIFVVTTDECGNNCVINKTYNVFNIVKMGSDK